MRTRREIQRDYMIPHLVHAGLGAQSWTQADQRISAVSDSPVRPVYNIFEDYDIIAISPGATPDVTCTVTQDPDESGNLERWQVYFRLGATSSYGGTNTQDGIEVDFNVRAGFEQTLRKIRLPIARLRIAYTGDMVSDTNGYIKGYLVCHNSQATQKSTDFKLDWGHQAGSYSRVSVPNGTDHYSPYGIYYSSPRDIPLVCITGNQFRLLYNIKGHHEEYEMTVTIDTVGQWLPER